MSVYPSPKSHNGLLNQTFNRDDYVIQPSTGGGGASLAQSDARYLKNSGTVVSSAATTFNGTVSIKGLASIDTIVSKQTVNTLVSGAWASRQTYSFKNGTVYSLSSNATAILSLAISDLPTTPLQTYTFTFIIEPSVKSSPYYLNLKNISINGLSAGIGGLTNVVLPTVYRYIIQTISIVNRSITTSPSFISYTSVYGYDFIESKTRLIAGGNGSTNIVYSDDLGLTWLAPSNQIFSNSAFGRCAFNGKRVAMCSSNKDIGYSDDYGITWISTGFTGLTVPFKAIYIAETSKWFAVGLGSGGQNMAISSNGTTWTLLATTTLETRVYDVIYNGSVYIAVGWSANYPMATSVDGITWTSNTNYRLDATGSQNGYWLFNDGSRYIFAGQAITKAGGVGGNIATSVDGITWDNSKNMSLPFDIRAIAYNGVDTYVAIGASNSSIGGTLFNYWSNDLITWNQATNSLLGNIFSVVWNGRYFVAGGVFQSSSSTNIIYSTDGKNWLNSSNPLIFGPVNGVSIITYDP